MKLFPESPRASGRSCGDADERQDVKLIVPLQPTGSKEAGCPSAPFTFSFQTSADRGEIKIHALSKRRAFIELTKNTFNPLVTDRDRLRGQFATAAEVANRVHIGGLSFPRSLSSLPSVRDAILADLASRST